MSTNRRVECVEALFTYFIPLARVDLFGANMEEDPIHKNQADPLENVDEKRKQAMRFRRSWRFTRGASSKVHQLG